MGSPPETIQTAHPDVEVMFLPVNTTALIQPMDQSVIASFIKAYYLRRVITDMLSEVNRKRDLGQLNSEDVVRNFWKNFNIAKSLSMVDDSWKEVKSLTLKNCWNKLLPDLSAVNSKETFNEPIIQEVTGIARDLGFNDVQECDFQDLVTPAPTALEVEEVESIVEESGEELSEPLSEEQKTATISLQRFYHNIFTSKCD